MRLCLKAQLKALKVGGSLKRDFTFKPPPVRDSVLPSQEGTQQSPSRCAQEHPSSTPPARESPTTTAELRSTLFPPGHLQG